MGLIVPKILQDSIAKLDDATKPLDEMKLSDQLAAAAGDPKLLTPEERRGAFAEIQSLRFQRARNAERRTWGIYWTELGSFRAADGRQIYIPDIDDVDEEILSHWIERSANAKHPVLRARFADLSWEIGRFLKKSSKKNTIATTKPISIDIPVALAHRAIDAYLKAVESGGTDDEHDAWEFLDRAIELSVAINDAARITKAKAGLFAFHQKMEKTDEKYMWWRVDDITWERAKALDINPNENYIVIAVLEKALARHSDISNGETFDPHKAMDAADRLMRRRREANEPEEAKQALKTAAAAFEEAAKGAQALVATSWLEDLIPRYRNAGMAEDAARVEKTIRDRAKEAQGEMKRIEVPLKITKKELDEWADRVSGSTLDKAIPRIAITCLIKEDSTRESIINITKNAPLMAMMPVEVMGSDGFTKATIGSIEDDLDGRTIQHAADLFNWHAPWLSSALNRAKEKHGIDIEKLIAVLAKSPFLAKDREPLLREGLKAWLAEDPVTAIHVLVPQIEAALRNLLAASGASVMIHDPNTGGFKAIGMGAILDHEIFRASVLKDIRFHLRALFCDSRGINLRNHLAHGIAHPKMFGMGLANWVIHAIFLLAALQVQSNST